MGAASYGTVGAPTTVRGFFVKPESRVRWKGTLETTSHLYVSYGTGASIGFTAGTGIDLGYLTKIQFTHNPDIQLVDSGNTLATLYELRGEKTEVTVGIKQFRPEVLKEAFGSGQLYNLSTNEQLITFGQGCTLATWPLVIEFSNVDCGAPSINNIVNGVSGGFLTLYATYLTSGIDWDMAYAQSNSIDLKFTAVVDTTKALCNRLGNLYMF